MGGGEAAASDGARGTVGFWVLGLAQRKGETGQGKGREGRTRCLLVAGAAARKSLREKWEEVKRTRGVFRCM
jgi:hypothetical protein